MKNIFFKAAIALAIILPLSALAYTSPGKASAPVNDFAGILSAEQKTTLNNVLSQNEQTTGNEITVVIMKNLGGDTVEGYAVKLFEEWGIGKKGKDNGVLFLVSIEDRDMRIEVGYGLEPYLTDATSGLILRNTVTPKFKEGDYFGGISAGLGQIISATKGEDIPVSAGENPWWGNLELDFFLLWLGLGILEWLFAVMARSKSWWLGGVLGAVIGLLAVFFSTLTAGLIISAVFVPLGLLLDFFISREYGKSQSLGRKPRWWAGGPWLGGGSFGGGGGFGGFGGGRSGGGGASGHW